MCGECTYDRAVSVDGNRQFAERVETSIALLDRRFPGWWKDVNVANLDLADATRCVLGQVAQARGSTYYAEMFLIANPEVEKYDPDQATLGQMFKVGRTSELYAFSPSLGVSWDGATQIWRERMVALKLSRNPVTDPTRLV